MIYNLNEILDTAAKTSDPMGYIRKNLKTNPALPYIFDLNFNNEIFAKGLETGIPSGYKYDSMEPIGLSQTALAKETRMLKQFDRNDLSETVKRRLFVQLLEALHFKEAEILIYAKDHALKELYTWIEPL